MYFKAEFETELKELLDKHKQLGNYRRNKTIREKYKKMREKGMTAGAARRQLAAEFFLGDKTIETILYKTREPQISIIGDATNRVIIITNQETDLKT